ncbi:DUF3618 domain-containing protein [Streptomyces sp. DH24]|uniref:DUF3618 domain-containing protein n=1 Tax=Streptomyces sp. DH24 TaxID=3040123 RepID=UPI00244121BC|nr:DUF3618 domain-containing protein [Streptomyces sp. DH24]MDG9715149.1 DUF3618 domain-containing protein [Streptomyces sp. DH24]
MTPAGAKGPDELRQQIERTRAQLGNTVEELAGKADVKGRARARAADLRDKAGAMTVQLRSSAAHAGHAVQGRAAKAGHAVQGKAAKAGHAVQDGVAETTYAAEHKPGPVRDVIDVGRHNSRTMLMAGAVVGAVIVAAFLLRRRNEHC